MRCFELLFLLLLLLLMLFILLSALVAAVAAVVIVVRGCFEDSVGVGDVGGGGEEEEEEEGKDFLLLDDKYLCSLSYSESSSSTVYFLRGSNFIFALLLRFLQQQ